MGREGMPRALTQLGTSACLVLQSGASVRSACRGVASAWLVALPVGRAAWIVLSCVVASQLNAGREGVVPHAGTQWPLSILNSVETKTQALSLSSSHDHT